MVVLSIKDRRGELPRVETTIEMDGKQLEAFLNRDGTVTLKPMVTETSTNGITETVYAHLPKEHRERLRKKAQEKGWELIEEETPETEVVGSLSGDLDFLDSKEMLRNAAKIGYTALAFRMGSAFAQTDSFGEIREYVRVGNGEAPARLFLNERFLDACAQGPHQHSVVIVGRRDKRRVDAIVRVFGGLSYFVNLSDCYEGADFSDTLVYDAQRGEINKVLVTDEQTEFFQVEHVSESKETIWDDQRRSGEWFVKFFDKAIQAKTEKKA